MSSFNKNGVVKSYSFGDSALVQDMKIKVLDDGSVWARILHHNNRSGTVLFTSTNVMNIQTLDLYSRLNILEYFRDENNLFEFMVIQPEISETTIYRWKQSNNPTNTSTVTGYVNISNGEGGLVKSNTSNTLCARSAESGNWWCAVGCMAVYNGGIPGFGQNAVKNSLDFYVRIDTLSKQTGLKVFDKFISTSDFIEI